MPDEHSDEMPLTEASVDADAEPRGQLLHRGIARSMEAAQDMTVLNSAAVSVAAGRDVQASAFAASAVVAGRNVRLTDGGAGVLVAGRSATVVRGFAGAVLSGRARVRNSTVGLIVGRQVSLRQGSRVLLSGPQALLFGIGVGAGLAIATALLRMVGHSGGSPGARSRASGGVGGPRG